MSGQDNDNYEVGYGRTPKDTRFKPGISGNPSGRPKKKKTSSEIFYDHMHKKQKYLEDGEVKSAPRIELIYQTIFNRAMKGEMAFIDRYLAALNSAEAEINARRFDPLEMLVNPLSEDMESEDQKAGEVNNPQWFIEMVEKEARLNGITPEQVFEDLIQKLRKIDSKKPVADRKG